ncbi:MAG: endonuclease III [Anaerolineales bacterium]|nr:endonuclease III [Anaerolineales bacterium]
MQKRPFDIDLAMTLIEEAVRPYPKAGLFELVEKGYETPFQMLVACIISIRTKDEVMIPVSLALFETAATAEAVSQLTIDELATLINRCSFYGRKAEQIHAIATQVVVQYNGRLPCDFKIMTSFKGVGPKCANLALGIACGEPQIGVDIHVHRITNRWGYVDEKTPEKTMVALEGKLPHRYWVEINRLLVPFGKHICTARSPKCVQCPLVEMCQQVGV